MDNIEMKVNEDGTISQIGKGRQEITHNFTDDELLLIGTELAEQIGLYDANKTEAKLTAASYRESLKVKKEEIDDLKKKIMDKCEVKFVDTEIHYNKPRIGMKQTIRLDNRETISTEEMTTDELTMNQLSLPDPDKVKGGLPFPGPDDNPQDKGDTHLPGDDEQADEEKHETEGGSE